MGWTVPLHKLAYTGKTLQTDRQTEIITIHGQIGRRHILLCVVVLGADDRVLSLVCQLAVVDDNLCPLSLAHEDVATARCDVTAIFEPPDVHVLGAQLTL